MKSILVSIAILIVISPLAAQYVPDPWMRSEGTLEGFAIDSQYFTLVTDANLRDLPGTKSNVLSKLPIGTAVTVVEVAEQTFTQRGVTLPWVKVRTNSTGAAPMTGYLWGGFLALAHIQTPDEEYMPNRGVLYLTGVAAYDSIKHQLTAQVRVSKDGKELARTEFNTTGDLSYYPSFGVEFPQFKNVNALLTVNYYYPACGYPSGNNLLFWQENGKLGKMLETSSVSDGGVFYSSEECVLPSDKGGIGNHILVVKDEAEFEEKGDDLVMSKQTYKITLYKWTGSSLKRVKDIK
ncbi:MAG: SH3 domain-containing protein [Saprospiraceae bacterium]|nr:SH3 domain-containing protein [Saprospiraceae bacterium]MCF8250161.1 SH3 domain-containing protein [Saprospiraceae bacterium]MCF8279424.1 SH3 domain-containing protein [Bacteroidales bacterium]MCF8311215.1 SH3 domain-containing protein [Saprospiraceae bacterium]MCF8440405.1 SH3 domain-containing protein [Saprospiraceae bacterium]